LLTQHRGLSKLNLTTEVFENLIRLRCCVSSYSEKPVGELESPVAASQESSNTAIGGQADIAAMVFSYRPSLKAIAASLLPEHLKSRVDDSDLVQETLLKAVAQADQIRATCPEQLEAWLKETLVNSVRDCIKFHGRQQRTISREEFLPLESLCSSDPSASEQIRKQETKEIVLSAVMDMPDDYRTVLLLRQQMDLTFPEIGERMKRTPEAARMLWGRALVALGEKLNRVKGG
jgi:RNA polymerase sigma-70 factor (ECF subfamily)